MPHRLLRRRIRNLCRPRHDPATLPRRLGTLAHERVRESDIKVRLALQVLDLLVRQLDAQRLDVVVQVLDLTSADDGEHVGRLLHHVRKRDGREGFDPVLAGDFLQRGRHFFLLRFLLAGADHFPQSFARFLALLDLFLGLELAAADDAKGRERHAEVPAHGNDLALKVAVHHAPAALVDGEGRLAMRNCISVGR